MRTQPPPVDEAELLARARELAGHTLADIAAALGAPPPVAGVHGKGKAGELIEAALGATGGPAARHDFPHLGIELKTVPVDAAGEPRESTYVCTLPLPGAADAEWEASWVRAKLSHVLFVPIDVTAPGRRVGPPRLWRPTPAEEEILRGDFEELVGLVGIGGIESLTAERGRWLQVRPKAASSRSRTLALGPDGEWLETVPRGFYLRRPFLRDRILGRNPAV